MKRAIMSMALLLCAGCPEKDAPEGPPFQPENLQHVDAAQFWQAYKVNSIAMDSEAKDRWAVLTGTVESIGKDILGTPYVTFDCGPDAMTSVQCMFPAKRSKGLERLRPGDSVCIMGRCTGMLGNVLFRDCWLVDCGENPR